ncbi:MAG TPA: methyl-accepting chemotaxis protein [Noviherbaspirillum sp.]|uniref:methyl-accepting chemotaxis protein n=1 Tax=Noviherbaspirillum sp. TaxID=1926288 RepID=UPI002B4637F4|nr:methyl-accepting chemotaxis protein [Noviherbaspirillum sp.]HJV84135.1 methyl-accepting chemotaxis protein [Noviherbaspirillum sp.]
MLSNLTLKMRIIAVIAFLSLELIIGGLVGIISLGNANTSMKTIYDDRLVCLGQLDEIVRLLNRSEMAMGKALTGDPAKMAPAAGEIRGDIDQADKIWTKYRATYLSDSERKIADTFAEHRKKYVAEALMPAMAALRAGDAKAGAEVLHGPMTTLFQPVRENINQLIKLQLDIAQEEYTRSLNIYRWVRDSCIVALTVGLLLAGLVGWWLVRAITVPVDKAVKVATSVASGDLTQEIDARSKDEMGQLMRALKSMSDGLMEIVSQVRNGTDRIANASAEIASGNMDLSSRTEAQASSLEETAASIEELTSTVKQNADNAHQANALAVSASEVASKGGAVVSQVIDTMGSIHDSSRKIVDIIAVIDGIAFQTNILALNAAVEAARAGEQGRGFAVVASEVRNLAQRSAGAAKEIKALINDSVEKVEVGSQLVDEAGATMREIVDSVRRVTDLMGEIAAASREQTSGIDQINQAITQMDQVTQQNAALVEQAAAASQALQEEAATLAKVVGVFKLDGHHAALAQSLSVQQTHSVTAVRPRKLPVNERVRVGSPKATNRAGTRQIGKAVAVDNDEWEQF